MIVVLNGPLGIGKSTLAEALAESIDGSVMLDGDSLVALNPPPRRELEYLHEIVALLVSHHQQHGYRIFVINHIWRTWAELDDLRARLTPLDPAVRVFLLTLPAEENLLRIEQRAVARALDELEWERQTMMEERAALSAAAPGDLGEPFDVTGPPPALTDELLQRLRLAGRTAGLDLPNR